MHGVEAPREGYRKGAGLPRGELGEGVQHQGVPIRVALLIMSMHSLISARHLRVRLQHAVVIGLFRNARSYLTACVQAQRQSNCYTL